MNPYADKNISPLEPCDGFDGKLFRDRGVRDLYYRIRLPENIHDGELHPFILSMHGAGSIGNDNLKQLFTATLFSEQEEVRKISPVIVAPQCPEGEKWVKVPAWDAPEYPLDPEPAPAMASLLKLLDHLFRKYPVDPARLYVTGASMGGFASWELLFRRPGTFAAAAIICGGCDLTKIPPRLPTAVELFHGSADPTVPAGNSGKAFELLKQRGAREPKYVEYPGVGHDAWTPAWQDPETAKWLLSHKLSVFSSRPYEKTMPDHVITLRGCGMTAKISPENGGNLFSLRHDRTGTGLLREPPALSWLSLTPERYGIPTLFPPNRIEDGKFVFRGKEYHLPVTEKHFNNHLHGLADNKPWEVLASGKSSATLRFVFDERDPRFEGFPFACELVHTYALVPGGLSDSMTIRNTGGIPMPLGLGYHTTFQTEKALLRISAGDGFFEVNARHLPTGKMLPWKKTDPRSFFDPAGKNIGFHTETSDQPFRGAEIRYPKGTLRYYLDSKFGFWHTWNNAGLAGFCSLEPVSWIGNALNTDLPPEKTGVRELAPGKSETFINRFEFEEA